MTTAVCAQDAPVENESAVTAPVVNPEDVPPTYRLMALDEPRLWNPDEVDDFTLVDQTGKEFTKADLLGKPWIVNFVFAQCSYQCPMTSRTMMEFDQTVSNVDLRMVTITVNPEEDTVDIMRNYAEIWGANPQRWNFATGNPDQVWQLIREGFKVSAWENVGTDVQPGMKFAHDNNIIHVDAAGKIVGRYDSTDPDEMAVLRKVLKGQIETPDRYRPVAVAARENESASSPEMTVAEFVEAANDDPLLKLPGWARKLPATNAMLNALSTLLLILGFTAIKARQIRLHKKMMLYAFGVSCVFLVSYLAYHYALHHYAGVPGKKFEGEGSIRTAYYALLISHVILAAFVPILAIVTIVKGLRQNWDSHKRWARVTFPIWLYVSVTGVMIYLMLYGIGGN